MEIIVCVKQTPETAEAELSILETGDSIDTKGLVFDINEWDEYSLEEALLLREQFGGSITAITIGPEGYDSVLRRCLAKGADKAIWMRDDSFQGSDAYATAKILHSVIKDLRFDLVLTGAQSSDYGNSAVGVYLAELLGIAHASMVKRVEVLKDRFRVNRELEGGLEEILELIPPLLLTIQTGINEPRYVSIMGIRRARKKEINIIGLSDLELGEEDVGEKGSWMKVEKMFRPPGDKETEILEGSPGDVATKLVEIIKARGLV